MKIKKIFRLEVYLLLIILALALATRLYKVDSPLADLHSWRQADTAAVARNFARDGIDLLHPRYDDLSGREAGIENPEGYRMVEFPIYNAITALLYKSLPVFPIEIYARLTSIFFSLLTIAVLYYLLLREEGLLTAAVGGFVYAVFPFFVFFSRVVLPETTALGLTFVSIYFLYLYTQKNISPAKTIIYIIVSLLFFVAAILVKPTVVFYAVVLIYLFIKRSGLGFLKSASFYLYFILSVIPFILWRLYIKNFPAGIPVSDWLFTSVNTYEGLRTIFLRPAFFRWIFYERLNNLILGGYLSIFFLMGILRKNGKFFFPVFLISMLSYLFIFEGGNVQHEYYQTIILPSIAIFIGLGVNFLLSLKHKLISFPLTVVTVALIFISSFFFSYYQVRSFYSVPQDLVTIAKIIKTITEPDAKIITDRTGDTTLLYLADRKGWPAYAGNLDYLKQQNYRYVVTANQDLIKDLKTNWRYSVIFQNDQFTIFKI
ncbi:hypothetical protein A2774_03830 [Candidatus Roizmanbacteria bacterium RIFCSPHIGHO2_01_FULL_39_12c]|uniref:Glycosyltransferase RgtA/B/C/D-like domain-containing protein n=1 Tax=Candidatus Roizmanbacteria bacterium RIFCSPHIGHO2_01_FULL_39_12c TaxID=1802031 RepID=A0A1F7GEK5_9BACT|nr:MAG: hypothetical protein A2774_03830 [Candidatus Roizmanbacteria bacterium RIFCSPHIGHO2_01_FULL_39_12c]OGK47964.1 MAG: hypothetical protein A2963_00020 [Candidatus Roizmanbacteria bacterium RIFCSPLOWO2_01_FULL_40_13]